MKGPKILAGVAGLALLMAGGSAQAQSIIRNNDAHPHFEIEVHGLAAFHRGYGFGGGARFGIPIVPSGFLSQVNDSFALSLGADFIWWAGYYGCFNSACAYSPFGIIGHIDAQWNFFIHEKFSAFAEAGFAPEFYFGQGNCGFGFFCPWFDFGVGGRWHFRGNADFPTLTFRVGSTGLTVGVSF
jgi:hypothetical protein